MMFDKIIVDAKRYELYYATAERFRETWLQQPYWWLYSHIQQDTTLLDVGAHIGDTAIYFAMHPFVRKVISYEPSPSCYSELLKSIKAYPLSEKITPINKAISWRKTSRRLPGMGLGASTSMDYMTVKESERGTKIDSITLNDALHGLSNVAIKCDAEGAEEFFFDDADLSKVYAIQLECHHFAGEKVLAILKQKDFKAEIRLDLPHSSISQICALKNGV